MVACTSFALHGTISKSSRFVFLFFGKMTFFFGSNGRQMGGMKNAENIGKSDSFLDIRRRVLDSSGLRVVWDVRRDIVWAL